MANWFPKNNNSLAGYSPSTQIVANVQAPDLPEIGDTVLVAAFPYGHQIVGEGVAVPNSTQVIELEVKAIKKAKITVE